MVRAFALALVMTSVCLYSSISAFAQDEIGADQRLPDGVLLYLSVPDAPAAHESFRNTGMGALINDPSLEAFRTQLVEKYTEFQTEAEDKLGLALSDITSMFAGELTLAVIRPAGQPLGGVLFMDIGNHQDVLDKLLAKVEEADEDEKVEKSTETIDGQEITTYSITVKDDEDADPVTIAYFVKDEKLVVASAVSILESVLELWDGESEETFAENEVYSTILDKTWGEEDSTPAFLYYVDPIGLLATGLSMNQDTQLFAGMIYSPAFGLNAFKGMGGTVELATEDYDSIGRTLYYVEGPASGLLKMFEFRPTISAPPGWVPAEAGQFLAMDWNLVAAYEAIESIYDSFTGPGKFAEVVAGLSQQSGTDLHLKKDVIDVLSGKFQWYLSPSESPEDMNGTLAIGVNDAAKGQKLIDTVLGMSGGAETSEFKGVQLSTPAGEGKEGAAAVKDKEILITKNAEQLKLTLTGPAEAPLKSSEAYKALAAEIPEKVSLLAYQNPADQIAAAYEKARAGEFDSAVEGKLDFSALPPFETLRKHFSPSASYFVPDENGTLGVQFTLRKK